MNEIELKAKIEICEKILTENKEQKICRGDVLMIQDELMGTLDDLYKQQRELNNPKKEIK